MAVHRVLFLFQAAVVREELMERSHPQKTTIAQTDGHAIAVHLTYPPAALRLSPPPSPFWRVIYPLFGLQFKHRRTEVITNEQRERILATYRPWIYGYKRIARELGLTRDQVRQVVVTTANQRRRKQMTSFEPNDYRVKKANSAYEDRDLSGYATDAEKIERLQDEIRLLRSLIVEYQKEFLPEALSEYPLFLSKDEVPLDTPSEDDGKDKDDGKEKKPRRSLKKKLRHRKEA